MDPVLPESATPAPDWRAFPAAAAQLAMIVGALWSFLFGLLFSGVLGWRLLIEVLDLSLLPTIACLLLATFGLGAFGAWLAHRRWRAAAWTLDDNGLQVRRGRWWRKEILVPRARVQHLDIERGPIERQFGLATLVVHTAGTRMNALRQSGFLDADAVALRDALVPAPGRQDDVL